MAHRRAIPRSARYAAALLCGALPVLAFPAPNLEFLAWFGLVPGLLLMRASPSPRAAAVAGWWFGAGYLLAALYWLIPNLGPGLLGVVAVLGALWAGVGAACQQLLRAPLRASRAAAALLVVPSCWLVTEWARSWQGFGGPWAVLGATQWQHPAVLALAAAGGVWLVTVTLVMANTGIVILLVSRRRAVAMVGVAGTVLAVAAGPAAFALTSGAPTARTLTVALVQPGVTDSPVLRADASQRLSAGLRRVHPGLIVWGESSVAFDLDTDTALRQQIGRLSAADGAQILLNQDTVTPSGGKSKVAVLIGPGGLAGRYTKTRLVPFGEYIPFRQQLRWLTRISRAAPQDMIPGTGAHVLRVTAPGGPLRVGVLICFESAFPDMAAADAGQGAQLIVYQTSDSTFQASWALAQHAALAALRAAETGRPAVQAALTGDSAAFDARGRLLAWAGAGDRGVLTVRLALPPASARTPFDRYGPYVPWTAVVIAAAAAGAGIIRAARARSGMIRDHSPAQILLNRNLRHSTGVCVSSGSNGHDPSAQGQRAADGPPTAG